MTRARVRRSMDRFRLVLMSITIRDEGALDFDAVTTESWNALIFSHGADRP